MPRGIAALLIQSIMADVVQGTPHWPAQLSLRLGEIGHADSDIAAAAGGAHTGDRIAAGNWEGADDLQHREPLSAPKIQRKTLVTTDQQNIQGSSVLFC